MTTPACGILFHFTHIDNLPSLLHAGALLSDTTVTAHDLLSNEAGDPEIKQRRRERPVTCPPGGVVSDYVERLTSEGWMSSTGDAGLFAAG